jgi:superfamily II DNA or RNA helicase
MPVWIRRSPEELEVLTGFLLSLDLENAGELSLPVIPLGAVARRLVELEKCGLPNGHKLRPYQQEAVWAAVSAPFGRSIIVAPMGAGKTSMCHAIAQIVGKLWVYMAPSQSLAAQTAENAPENLICTSFTSARTEDLQRCEGVIADECHRLGAHTWSRVVLRSRARFRIGLSGTALMRSDPRNALVVGLLGPVVYRISLEVLQSQGFLATGRVTNIVL